MLTGEQKKSAITKAAAEEEEKKNQGGFLGGIGYSLEKVGLGFLSGIEGIWDFTAGGLAKLFGADDWAEQQVANDWVNYNHADEWFNPSEGWQFVGDVAGGIGTSAPSMLAIATAGAITVASGGTLSPVAATLIAGGVAGLGAAGRATKEAYDKTGELTGKEFGYGALVGVTEGAIEGVSNVLGAGTGAVTKSIAKSFGKEVAKSATRNTLLKGVVKGFAGEAFEEGVQAILEPYYKRMTYDPNARNATAGEVAYAALVGGLSGAIMGGGDVSFRNIRGATRGNTLVSEGKAADVITTAEQISAYQTENQTDYETFQVVQNTLAELNSSLQKTGGQVQTLRQKMLLGVLEQANTSAAFEPIVTASAENIYNNAETVAARLNELGYQDQNGKPIQVTAEQIREGIDTTDAKSFRKTMSRALKTNSALRTLAVADTVGQISMDTARFRDAALSGQSEKLIAQADLNRFIEQATDAERQAVAERLGVESWETLTNEQFQDKIKEFVASGGVQEYQQSRGYVREAQSIAPETAKKHIPRMVNLRNDGDGAYRYTQGDADIAIIKRGDTYYIYNYADNVMSKPFNRTETNKRLREIIAGEQRHVEEQNRLREQAAEIDTYARENIPEYKNLSAAGQAAIRATIRQGRAAGVQEDFVLSCARVSAHSGLRVVFSKGVEMRASNGKTVDGYYSPTNKCIYINPEAKSRSGEMIIIHELTHAIYTSEDGVLTAAIGQESMGQEQIAAIREEYEKLENYTSSMVDEEVTAHYTERALRNKNVLERLVQKKQTLKEKVLGFFKKARTDYQGDARLTGAADRLYRQYKKLFDEFYAHNQRYLGTENASVEAQEQATDIAWRNKPRLAIKRDTDGNAFVEVKSQIADSVEQPKQIAEALAQIVRTKFTSLIDVNGQNIGINQRTAKEWLRSKSADKLLHTDSQAFLDKVNAFNNADELLKASKDYVGEAAKHARKDNFVEFARGVVAFKVGDNGYEADIIVGTTKSNAALLYDVVNIQRKKIVADTTDTAQNRRSGVSATTTNSISQNRGNVNTSQQNEERFALPADDSDGNALSNEQRTFFSQSKITDAEGRLLSLYHGSNAYDEIHVFRRGKNGYLGGGIYLTDSESYARKYADKNGYKGRIYNVYADAKNPLEVSTNTPAKEILRAIYGSDRVYDRRSSAQSYETQIITSSDIRKLRENGYDAIVWRFGGDTEVSVFEANQIKLTSNKAPTTNNDVRYALSVDGETINGTVEETRNLVALHNLSEENLLRVIELGGFPMPSIAVTKTDLPHENFGSVTVVFGRETIDPESDSRNVVYDRDAWTPTTPIIEVKLSNQGVDSLIAELQKKVDGQSAYKSDIDRFFDGQYRDNNGDYVVRDYDYTKEAFGDRAMQSGGIMAAYLSDKGVEIEPVYAERGFAMGWESYSRDEAARLFELVGITKDLTRHNATEAQRQSILEKFIDYKAKSKLRFLRKFGNNKNMTLEEAREKLRGEYDDGNISQLFFMAEDFFNEKRPKDIYDKQATVRKMQEKISDKQDFYDWLWRKVESVYEKRGIDNDSDVYDRRGNRRSFEQRHFPYTAANIVKAMSKGAQEGKVNLGMTAGALAARLSRKFDSIEDIRDAQDYLALVSEEDLKKFNDRTYELYDELVTSIAGKSTDFMSDSTRRSDVGEILAACASAKPLTVENIKRVFERETRGYDLGYKFNDNLAEQAVLLFESLKHIPTTYFEAKPRRVVKLSEIKYVLVPESASERLRESLKKSKISYREYSSEANDRARTLARLDGVRFALPESDSDDSGLSEQQRKYFNGSKVVDGNGRLLVAYHGSPNQFYTFDRNRIGKGTDQFGAGFYFATNEDASRHYGDNVHKTYLNIQKPIVINRTADGGDLFDVKITQKQAYEILKRHPLIHDPESSPLGDIFEEYWEVGAKDYMIREAAKNFTSIGLLDSDYTAFRDYPNELHEALRDVIGYDGVEVRFDNSPDKFYVAWFEDQIKLTSNKSPTKSTDIRYALPETDSAGVKLSQEQREFFKDSKVVDENGNLRVMYHGSNAEFSVFDESRISSTTKRYMAGFYFTAEKRVAEKWSRYRAKTQGGSPAVFEVYLNIKKPLYLTEQEYKRLGYDEKYRETVVNQLFENQNDGILISPEQERISGLFEDSYNYELDDSVYYQSEKYGITDKEYAWWLLRAVQNPDFTSTQAAVLRADQVKLVANKQPTSNADMRFALSDSGTNIDGETATWTADRVDDLIERYGATNPRYTQAYATWINPADFVKATTSNQTRRNQIYDEAGNLDIDRLSRESQTPYLSVDYETMRIVGHEGRHRMAALAKAGVKRVAVAIRFTESSLSRYDAHIMEGEHSFKGQRFTNWDNTSQRRVTRTSHNSALVGTLIPINAAYSAQLSEFTSERGLRFALDSSDDGSVQTRSNYSVVQRARFVANNTGMRVYSKAEAADVINSIIEERLVFDEIGMYGELRGKDRQAAIDYLFKKLNTVKEGYRGGVALRIADFLIEHTVLTDMYADSGATAESMRTLSVLRQYMHRMDLSQIQGEIQYRYDKKNSINLIWGAKEGGIAPDTLPQFLADEGIHIDAINEADIFFEMVDMYEEARANVNNTTEKVMLTTYGDARTIKNLRQQIARDVLNAYEQKGRKSKYAKLVEKYTAQIAELRRRLREANANNRLINSIVDQAQKMRDLKLGTYINSSQFKSEVFKSSIEALGKIKFRGNFNVAGTRKIMADLRTWYTKDNPLLADNYEQGIADMLDAVASGTKGYTKEELRMIHNLMAYFTNFVENFNKFYRQGRWIDAQPEATRYINLLHENEGLKSSWLMRKVGVSYLQTFGDPMSVARRMDRYGNGFYTEMLTELRDAKIQAEITHMELLEGYEAFLKRNKKYLYRAAKEMVLYRGVEVPKLQLVSLYMTLKRQHAQAGLAENGFWFWNTQDQRVRVEGFAKGITEESELRAAAVDEQAAIAQLLSETDKEYIAVLEKGFQEAGRLKSERDMQRLGFTNATEDYYYPIRRGNIAKNIDSVEMQQEIDRISNASFNKDTVRGAKQELYIEPADAVFNRHLRGVVQYAMISPAIEAYNKLYNLDIAGTPNKPVSVATESANTWKQGNEYFRKLISDIQGISPVSTEGRKFLSYIRGSYAKFQLGANPKVWVTQLSSLFAASSMLDTSSIMRGMTVSAKGIDIYCPLAKLRAKDNVAAMAQGVLDKVGKVSDVLMAPIGKMDRFVVRRLFGACQVQVEKNGEAKVGTEANKVEAGKLLTRVILETQQNSLATERSAAMRSGNEIMRTLTMFSADAMKVIGRVIDSFGERSMLKSRLRTTTDATARAELQSQLKAANRKLRKSLTALATSALFMAAVAQLFKWLYDKDRDEDETAGQEILVDFMGNLIGGLPIARDIYSRVFEGFDVDNFAYSALNDLLDSALGLFDAASNLITGDESRSKFSLRTKNFLYSIGQLTGIPTRNIYNVFYGLTKRFSPTSAYKIDEFFYAKNYVTDLNKAIENDDTEMISMLMSMVFGERIGNTTMSDAMRNKFVDLYSKGHSVLPRSIGDTISYAGVEIPLTEQEHSRFVAIYGQAVKDIETMLSSGAFVALSDEMQAAAIKQVYDAYYYNALSDLVGVDERTTIGELSQWIDMSKLAVTFAGLSKIESDKNAKGETVSGSKKKNTVKFLMKQRLSDGERLLILCSRGYAIQDGDYKGYSAKRAKRILLQYIMKLRGTQAQKAELAAKCGFTVKNNKIIKDF